MKFTGTLTLLAIGAVSLSASAQNGVAVHGSVQSDNLFPTKPYKDMNDKEHHSDFLTNTYADVGLISNYVGAPTKREVSALTTQSGEAG